MAKGSALPDNRLGSTLTEWRGLVRISDNEMHGKAAISRMDGTGGTPHVVPMTGQYVFHKLADGGWVLDAVDFSSSNGFVWWRKDVFQKVE